MHTKLTAAGRSGTVTRVTVSGCLVTAGAGNVLGAILSGGGLSLRTISPHGGEERPTAGYRNAAIISDQYETAVNCAKHGSAP